MLWYVHRGGRERGAEGQGERYAKGNDRLYMQGFAAKPSRFCCLNVVQTYLKTKPRQPFELPAVPIHTNLLVRARPSQFPGPQIDRTLSRYRLLVAKAAKRRRDRRHEWSCHSLCVGDGVLGRGGREQSQGPLGREAQQGGQAGHGCVCV